MSVWRGRPRPRLLTLDFALVSTPTLTSFKPLLHPRTALGTP